MHQTRIRRAYYRIFRVANTPDLGIEVTILQTSMPSKGGLHRRRLGSSCAECNQEIEAGERMVWDVTNHKAYCRNCGQMLIGPESPGEMR